MAGLSVVLHHEVMQKQRAALQKRAVRCRERDGCKQQYTPHLQLASIMPMSILAVAAYQLYS
jgi:hypothetical protein